MNKLKKEFDQIEKEGLISGSAVVDLLKLYGLSLTRRTLAKWVALGVVPPPKELTDKLGKGRRTGFTYDSVNKIVALRITLNAVNGLGKGSRIKRRFTAVAAAVSYVENKHYKLGKVAECIDFAAIGLAHTVNGVVAMPTVAGKTRAYAKVVKIVAMVYCFVYMLLTDGPSIDIVKQVNLLRKRAVLNSTKDVIGLNESRLSTDELNSEMLPFLDTVLTNVSGILCTSQRAALKSWAVAIRYFDTNGWLSAMADEALKEQGYKSFVECPKANWLAAVLLSDIPDRE